MKRSLVLLACLSLVFGACMKTNSRAKLESNGSGSLHYEASYSVQAIEDAKGRLEEARARAEENGGGRGDMTGQAEERLKKFLASFEPDQVRSDLKSQGYDVKEVKAVEGDGWKGVVVDASFKDVNSIVDKAREKRDAARAAAEAEAASRGDGGAGGGGDGGGRRGRRGMGGMGRGADTEPTPNFVNAFQKTSEPKLGKVVLQAGREMPEGGAGGRQGGRGGRGGGGGPMGGANMEDFRRTIRLTVPGKIAETKNCKKEDDSTIVMIMNGSDMQPDEEGNMSSMITTGAWFTFEIPEGCTVRFDDPAGKKPEPKPAEAEGEKKARKGDLKIGGGG